MYKTILISKDDLSENKSTSLNFGGNSFIFYRFGEAINVYDSNRENPRSLFPYPVIASIGNCNITIAQDEAKEPYSVDRLGIDWYIAFEVVS